MIYLSAPGSRRNMEERRNLSVCNFLSILGGDLIFILVPAPLRSSAAAPAEPKHCFSQSFNQMFPLSFPTSWIIPSAQLTQAEPFFNISTHGPELIHIAHVCCTPVCCRLNQISTGSNNVSRATLRNTRQPHGFASVLVQNESVQNK